MCFCPLGVPVCSECVSEQMVEMYFYFLSSCFLCILIYNLCMGFKLIAVFTKENKNRTNMLNRIFNSY